MRRVLASVLVSAVLAGCVTVEPHERRRRPDPVYVPAPGRPVAAPNIPKGHLPPPGSCRIWYSDRPPGHQPPPGSCEQLRYQVPPGASLIRG
jgi:hypothetical protein